VKYFSDKIKAWVDKPKKTKNGSQFRQRQDVIVLLVKGHEIIPERIELPYGLATKSTYLDALLRTQ